MNARLICRAGEAQGSFEIGREATIGRAAGNTIALDPPLLSSQHARIFYDRKTAGYFVEDLGSTNGTAVDGERLSGPERLGHLNVITLAGRYDFVFVDLDRSRQRHGLKGSPPTEDLPRLGARAPEGTVLEKLPLDVPDFLSGRGPAPPTLEEIEPLAEKSELLDKLSGERTLFEALPQPVPDFLRAGGESGNATEAESAPAPAPAYWLVLSEPGGKIHKVQLREGENLVGRGAAAQVQCEAPQLSRRHATVIVTADRVELRDEGSRHKTYLEGEPVEGAVEIPEGARLRFANVEARVVCEGREEEIQQEEMPSES